jgi:hypothetical protein
MKRQRTICDKCGHETRELGLSRSEDHYPWTWSKVTVERYSMGTERWVPTEMDLCESCTIGLAAYLDRDTYFNKLEEGTNATDKS